ncbi:Phage tail tube protein, GTA-gp10 [Paracoccus isoporae]|uniref:Phage tail tube protein, GTA-gp10 n=1 Tax=Paracoccus isoporae TaxID=591205 RepID=A0A1G7EVV8_9RHOB|nr:gene transfer agent family protein [Paracoccus isoporae]SDE67761.1 Phage tail tube protein, GTA-gp10 [Paracoccus isoporae]
MANPMRGEVEVTLDGVAHPARLTLGALAELEAELQAASLIALAERFEAGRFSAADVLAVLVAGLRGAGWNGDRAVLMRVEIGGGPVGAAQAAARLLHLAFALPE